MKKENLTLQEERRRDKDVKRAKRKEQKQKERTQRLAHRNPARIERQLADLERKGLDQLTTSEKHQLSDLRRDLEDILRAKKRSGVEYKAIDRSKVRHNKRSVYYDAALNPSGEPPSGWPTKMIEEIDSDDGYTTSESVSCIPMPQGKVSGTKPANKKNGGASQTVYESGPQLRDFTKEQAQFVPTTLSRKKRKTQESSSNVAATSPHNLFPALPEPDFDDDEDEEDDNRQPHLEDASDEEL